MRCTRLKYQHGFQKKSLPVKAAAAQLKRVITAATANPVARTILASIAVLMLNTAVR
jgi:hypothetical protein